ncbi:MAG: hypothetical protein AB8B80_00845 [Marinicellaceae bacterium]
MKQKIPFTTFIAMAFIMLLSFQSSASLNDATWYVTIDVDKIESNEIYKIFEQDIRMENHKGKSDFIKIPEEISFISFYGNAEGAEDATAVIHGDFTQFSVNAYVLDFLYSQDDVSEFINESSVNYKNHEIQILEVDEEEGREGKKIKEVYFSKVNNQLSVISFQLNEVKNWLDNTYDGHSINNGELFSVVVDVKSALAHMGMNIDKNTHMMQSEIFQKVTQASFSISEVNSDMVLDVALTTTDEATAKQIEQIINGLVAMANLSGANDENELQSAAMQNINIERKGTDILISSYVSIEDLKKEAQKEAQSLKDGYKVEVKVGS